MRRGRRKPGSGPGTATRTRAVLLLTALLFGFSCGGDGGGDMSPVGGPCLAFTPAAAPASGTVSTRTVASGCSTIDLQLQITDVSDIFAVQFTVSFDPGIVTLEGVSTDGSVLRSDGASVDTEIGGSSGMVLIGVTRLASSGRDAVGTANLLTLRFRQVTVAGATLLSYGATRVLGSEMPPQEKLGISWTGGGLENL